MNENLVKQLKNLKSCLVNKPMDGEDWQEKQEMIGRIEELTVYLNDASARGVDFESKI